MTSRLLFPVLTIVSIVLIGLGCEELPSDPNPSQQIIGDWKASRIGTAFKPAGSLEFGFKASGDLNLLIDAVTYTGTYTTTGSTINTDVREISLKITGIGDLVGIYEISGNQMKLEVVPDPFLIGSAPTPMGGIGSTIVGGVRTNDYVTELQRK